MHIHAFAGSGSKQIDTANVPWSSLRHSIRVLDILCALIGPAVCDTINSYGAQTFKEPTT